MKCWIFLWSDILIFVCHLNSLVSREDVCYFKLGMVETVTI